MMPIEENFFEVGNYVYVHLHPYRQVSVSLRRNLKLAPRFYGPLEIVERIGNVAYKLKLPAGSRIHPVFHVSCLKRRVAENVDVQETLSVILEE